MQGACILINIFPDIATWVETVFFFAKSPKFAEIKNVLYPFITLTIWWLIKFWQYICQRKNDLDIRLHNSRPLFRESFFWKYKKNTKILQIRNNFCRTIYPWFQFGVNGLLGRWKNGFWKSDLLEPRISSK